MPIKKLLSSLLVLLVLPSVSQAHLAAGEDRISGSYLVDFGYDPVEPQVGQATSFAINLAESDHNRAVNFTHVWVRIATGDTIVFAGTIHQIFAGNATLSYSFPEKGVYDVTATFYQDDQQLVSETFQIEAHQAEEIRQIPAMRDHSVYYALAGFVIGALITHLGWSYHLRSSLK